MAVALGFGQGNQNTPMSGSTGGGQVLQAKVNPDGSLGATTDGSGGIRGLLLNYLKGAAAPAAASGAAGAVAPAATGAAGF